MSCVPITEIYYFQPSVMMGADQCVRMGILQRRCEVSLRPAVMGQSQPVLMAALPPEVAEDVPEKRESALMVQLLLREEDPSVMMDPNQLAQKIQESNQFNLMTDGIFM